MLWDSLGSLGSMCLIASNSNHTIIVLLLYRACMKRDMALNIVSDGRLPRGKPFGAAPLERVLTFYLKFVIIYFII